MIEIKQLYKSYGELEVLKDINLTVNTGEIYGLVGPSGVGKSTLLNCLTGLEIYQSGSIAIDGIKLETLSELKMRQFRKNMGMIFQNFSLIGRKDAFHNIALPMECWKYPKNEIKNRVEELAELTGIQDKLKCRPSELSGGQKQRVAIARALVMNPKYLLCDECTSALDPKSTVAILGLLKNLQQKFKITIIVVTHEMDVIQNLCERMAILDKGEVSLTGNVKEIFETLVEKEPNNIAVVDGTLDLTYRELNEKANSLANYLMKKGIQKGDIIPVVMNKSLNLIISMFAIIKCGGVYLPVAADYPQERVDYILKNCNAKIALTTTKTNIINDDSVEAILIDNFDFNKYSHKNPEIELTPNDSLYIIYTSGSTGNPKGARISHRNLVNLVSSFTNLFNGIDEIDNCLSSTNMSFDVSVWEFFITLLNGATLYIYEESSINDIFKYCKAILKYNITLLYIPPNILESVYSILSTYSYIPINKLLLGVEPIGTATIRKYIALKPNMRIVNGYGPTETTVCATACVVDDHIIKNYRVIPLGKPLHNDKIFILNKNLSPVPVDVPGEIYVSGDGVGKGYLNNKELNDKAFIELPNLNIKRAYKTGDLAKWNEDGTISFIGRKDFQVKVNGHRIELGEIEACIYQYPNIEKVVVLLDDSKRIVAYFSSEKAINVSDLKAFIQRKLPSYFIPSFFVQVEKFKLTSNGKVDMKALRKLKYSTNNNYEAPHNKYQSELVEIFKTILNLEKVGINDNFFELGGDSLSAIKLQIEAFNKGLELSYKDIFTYPTIKQLSENVSKSSEPVVEKDYDYSKIDELIKHNTLQNNLIVKKDKENRLAIITDEVKYFTADKEEEFIIAEASMLPSSSQTYISSLATASAAVCSTG